MKMDQIAGSQNDEFYTPEYAIHPLVKRIPVGAGVWCPFDTDRSNFVKLLKSHGCNVINTHLESGHNFFECDAPSECEYIISNPPYSLKYEVFEKLFAMDKSFAMLVGVVGLFESIKRFNLFRSNDFDLMYFDKRISYFKNYDDQKPSLNPPFSSVYVTRGILENRIIFETIDKNEKLPEWLK